jgi:F-type H+-transporting ATPase subunit epsilon
VELSIVTPDRSVVVGKTTEVIIPGINGEFDVLPGHAPKIAMLGTGVLRFTTDNKQVRLMVSGGFAEVESDRIVVMCDHAALDGDVAADTDKASLQALEAKLRQLGAVAPDNEAFVGLKAELDRASARLSLR